MKLRTIIAVIVLMAVLTPCRMYSADRTRLAPTPPMGFMTWNSYRQDISDSLIRRIADRMVEGGYLKAGYKYLCIDDCWQGGRDKHNNIIPDPEKFPHGMKALVDYVHSRGLKVGIYSDAAQLTCAGLTASYGFEKKDAKTFASWGIDYLKYDYCHAPSDSAVAHCRYQTMAEALSASGRDIVLGVCEWGQLNPEMWASHAGGSLWRTTYDIVDTWVTNPPVKQGIYDILRLSEDKYSFAGRGRWLDMDQLIVGIRGRGLKTTDAFGAKGCSDVEYQTQMSLWCMMASPLLMSHDILNEDSATRSILLNSEIIAIDQDTLCEAAYKVMEQDSVLYYMRHLAGNRIAVAALNAGETSKAISLPLLKFGISGSRTVRDVWRHSSRRTNRLKGTLKPHETMVVVVPAN